MQPAARVARTSTDLVLVIAASLAAALVAALDLPVAVRLPLGMLAVLVLPGYALSAALFPATELDRIERAAASTGLSFGLIVLAAPFVAQLPGGLNATSVTLSLTCITVGLALAALLRRQRTPAADGAGGSPGASWLAIARLPEATLPFAIVLIAGVAMVGIGLGFASRPSTEFFLIEPQPSAGGTPLRVSSGEPVEVHLGITAPVPDPHRYRIEAESDGVRLGELGPIEVDDAGSWEGTLQIALSGVGAKEVRLVLLIDGDAAAYRELRLELEVTAASAPAPA